MFWIFAAIAYSAPAVIAWRTLAGHVAWKEARTWSHGDRTDAGNWMYGTFTAFWPALVWPLAAVFVLLVKQWVQMPAWPLAMGAEARARSVNAEREMDERERKIAKAERELGIS